MACFTATRNFWFRWGDNKGMRKTRILVVAALFATAAMTQAQLATSPPPSAEALMSAAKAKAAKESKAVWAVFHASW